MLFVCPACVSTYRVEPATLAAASGAARCAHCRRTFEPGETAPRPSQRQTPSAATLSLGSALTLGARTPPVRPARAKTREPRERSAFPVMAGVIALLALGMAATAWPGRLLQAVQPARPLFASLGLWQPHAGLTIENVRSTLADDASGKVLTVEGEIANSRDADVTVPDIRVVVRGRSTERVYSWTAEAPKAQLGPGESVSFQSRLVSPPQDGHDLVVSFAEPSAAPVGGETRDGP